MGNEIENAYVNLLKLPYQNWVVGYSGGLDSTVLVDLVRRVLAIRKDLKVVFVHVNHSVNARADAWAEFCKEQLKEMGLECVVERIPTYQGPNLENYWREKRYGCLRRYLVDQGCLLTAHHAVDQAETFFLRLFRSSGLRGLSSMKFHAVPYSQGFLFRPLLKVDKKDILSYARFKHLKWIEDDSNQNLYYERNFLRFFLPFLAIKWPKWVDAINQVTENLQKNLQLLEEYLADDLKLRLANHRLNFQGLSLLKLETLFSYWLLRDFNLVLNRKQRLAILAIIKANKGTTVKIKNFYLFRYQNYLYIDRLTFGGGKIFILKNECYDLQNFNVRYYQGGEKIKLVRRGQTHRLKKLFQEWQVPPFYRQKIPLLFYRDQLVAIIGFENNEIVQRYEMIDTAKSWKIER